MISEFVTSDDVTGAINSAKAGIVQEARKDLATTSMISEFVTLNDVTGAINNAKAGIISSAKQGMATSAMVSEVDGKIASFEAKVADGTATIAITSDNFTLTPSGDVTMSGDITAKKLIMEPSTPSIPDSDIAWFSFEKVNDVLSPVLYWKYEGDIYFLNMSSLIQKKTGMKAAATIYTIDGSSTIKVLKPINTFQQYEINTDGTFGNLVSNKYYTLDSSTGKYSPLSDGYYYQSFTTKGSVLPHQFTVTGGSTLTPYNCLIFVKIGVYGRYKYENDKMQSYMDIVGGNNFIMALPNEIKLVNKTLTSSSNSSLSMRVNTSYPQYTILTPNASNILAYGSGSYFHSTVDNFSSAWLRAAIFKNCVEVSPLTDYITKGGSNYYTGLVPHTGSVSELTHYEADVFMNSSNTTFSWLKKIPS